MKQKLLVHKELSKYDLTKEPKSAAPEEIFVSETDPAEQEQTYNITRAIQQQIDSKADENNVYKNNATKHDVTFYGAFGDGVTDDTDAIEAAVAAAIAGDIIYFPRGTYLISNAIAIAKSLHIRGEPGAVVSQATADTDGFDVTASVVSFGGLTITGDGDGSVGTSRGIYIRGTDGSTVISDISVRNCKINDWSRYGVFAEYLTDFQFSNNDFDDIFYCAIAMASCLRGQVVENNINNISGSISSNSYGILMFRWTNVSDNLALTPRCQDIIVSENVIRTNATWQAINTHAGIDLVIANNTIQDCKYGIFVGPSNNIAAAETWAPHNCSVIGNVIQSGVIDGTYVYGIAVAGTTGAVELARNNRVVGNHVEGYGLDSSATAGALRLNNTIGSVISGNTLKDSSRSAITIQSENYGFVCNGNTIMDSWTDAGAASFGIYVPDDNVFGVILGNSFVDGDLTGKTNINDRCINTDNNANVKISVGSNHNNGWTLYLVAGQAHHFNIDALVQRIGYGTAAPTAGTWVKGDIVLDTNASYADRSFVGWYCTTGGTPGTWKEYGRIDFLTLATFGDGTTGTSLVANAGGSGDATLALQFGGVAKWLIFRDFTQDGDLRIFNSDLSADAINIDRGTNAVTIPGLVTGSTGSVITVFNVQDYGATGDGSTDDYSDINDAHTAATVNGGFLYFPEGTYKLSSSITFNADVTLLFEPGAMLSIDSTKVVTINGGLQDTVHQIFSGSGTVTFGSGGVPHVIPQWWGAVGDDSTDCAAAFNSALDAITNIGKMVIPPGIYRTTVPIDSFPVGFKHKQPNQIIFEGSGRADTIIKYMGTSGYAIETHNGDTSEADILIQQTRMMIRDMTVRAENLSAAGGCILSMGYHNRFENLFLQASPTYGTAYKQQRGTFIVTENSFTPDTDRAFTSSGGGGATESYAIKYTTPVTVTGNTRAFTIRLKKLGSPAGTITVSLWSDDGGAPSEPNALLGGASQTIACNDLDAAGADEEFIIEWEEKSSFVATTAYWIVVETNGFTQSVGVTEVYVMVEAAGGGADTFATYDDGGGSWSTSADGANYVVENAYRFTPLNFCVGVDIEKTTSNTNSAVGVNIAEDCQLLMTRCNVYSDKPIYSVGNPWLALDQCNIDQSDGNDYVVDFTGVAGGTFDASNTYFEGGSTTFPIHLGKVVTGNFIGCPVATSVSYTPGYGDITYYGRLVAIIAEDHNSKPPDSFDYKIFTPDSPSGSRRITLGATATTASDADALTGTAFSLPANLDIISVTAWIPPGMYKITMWAKATTPDGTDVVVRAREDSGVGSEIDLGSTFALTTSYAPYTHIIRWPSGTTTNKIWFAWQAINVNGIFISHCVLEYLGPLTPGTHDITVLNAEEGDADGDRATSINFQGFQSGGEQTLLAQITASHDGAADDEKGKLEMGVNEGSDGFTPTVAITIDSDQVVATGSGRIVSVSRYTTTQTLGVSDHHVACDTDGGAFTVTLPAGIAGTEYKIANTGTSGNDLTVAPNGAELLIGVNSNFTLTDGEALYIEYEATEGWF